MSRIAWTLRVIAAALLGAADALVDSPDDAPGEPQPIDVGAIIGRAQLAAYVQGYAAGRAESEVEQ